MDAIGHPTGRLIERREPYAIDLDAVFAAAARTGTMLEINANPDRRDLSDVHARAAARAGVTIVIDSDAHRTGTLANMRWGVATARRAWLTQGGCGQHAAVARAARASASSATGSQLESAHEPSSTTRRRSRVNGASACARARGVVGAADRPARRAARSARSSPTSRGSSARAIGSAA